MNQETTYTDPSIGRGLALTKRISWSAVFAGVLVAIVTQMLLTLLGLGIGFGALDTVEEQNPTAGLGIGTAIWYMVSSLVSLFIGGWVAGRLASTPRLFDGIIHGVLTWCLVTLLTVYLLTTAIGRIIGGASSLVSGIVKTAGSGIATAAPGLGDQVQQQLKKNGVDIDLNDLKGEVNQLLRDTGKPGLRPEALERQADQAGNQAQNAAERTASNPQRADETADGIINQFLKRGEGVADQFDRNAAINVVMKRTGKSRAEAEQTVDNWNKTYQQARIKFEQTKKEAEIKARHVADDAASAASKGAIFGFIGLLIGVAAAGYGAKQGTDSKDDYNRHDRPVGEVR
ncbi:MAG: hypothetical protein JWP57_3659 [Spirosoma sp.]|nr:hypothetical protein [Spirosoma sp.]